MTALRAFSRWIALAGSFGLCLLLLNSALYRAWLAGGPPTDNSQGWLFSSWSNLSWSAAAAFAGIGLFLLLRQPPRIRPAIVLLGLALVLVTLPWLRELLASDACLDAGGRVLGPVEA